MGAKSRGGWNIPYCMKENKCVNKGKLCKECIKYNKLVEDLEPLTDDDYKEFENDHH